VRRAAGRPGGVSRWFAFVLVGGVCAVLAGRYLVIALLACGLLELLVARRGSLPAAALAVPIPGSVTAGGLGALAWTAFKVGALAFGGGFVIVPLMQSDAVHVYHWMSQTRFLNAVALGQVTPGPVVATVAAVGYAAHGLAGGMLAAGVAFAPSFTFVLLGGARFERLRGNATAQSFLAGAGPAAIGAILGAAVTLAGALQEGWQFGLLAIGAPLLLIARRGVVRTLVAAGLAGVVVALAGGPLP
jgi:chromate transporter